MGLQVFQGQQGMVKRLSMGINKTLSFQFIKMYTVAVNLWFSSHKTEEADNAEGVPLTFVPIQRRKEPPDQILHLTHTFVGRYCGHLLFTGIVLFPGQARKRSTNWIRVVVLFVRGQQVHVFISLHIFLRGFRLHRWHIMRDVISPAKTTSTISRKCLSSKEQI